MNDYYTSKVTVEVEVTHYGTAEQGAEIITNALRFPATQSIKVIGLESNFQLHKEPLKEMVKIL